ncbi:MAG TPA: sigma-70 family RNA polymerase sigma factor [Frankiaceae bacterium]|nr:sigma-70 family RNA polymerase sigma factor [Frankiaceae bacterium]
MSAEPLHLVPASDDSDERFQVLYRRYYGRVKGLAARRFPTFDAEDVAQETMVRVLLHAHRIDPARDPWPYIAAIAVNVARDFGRARVPEAPLTEESYERELAPPADEPVLAADRSRAVQDVLAGLAPGSRQVLALQAFDEMTVGEIAAFLGTNDNAVRQKLFRARNQFRRALASVPSGAFGIAALVRLRRRLSAANVAQGGGLSFSSAAALAVAVAGAVTFSVAPHGGADRALATPSGTVLVEGLGASGGALPEAASKARLATAGTAAAAAAPRAAAGVPRPAAPAPAPLVHVAPKEAPVLAHVDTPGNLFNDGRTNHERVGVDTPYGFVGVDNTGTNSGGPGTPCSVQRRIPGC